ncbi:MAG: VCBS repeat-containing protein [Verrucomicrobia bacterium]|nr:VCBS repeat-containing protein [Verrucomicrobiota bacterium]
MDGDGFAELIVATEWGPIRVFKKQEGRFVDFTKQWGLAELTGWWTSVAAGDFDGDGRLDLACGNWGRNSTYELYPATGFRLFYGDWSGAGGVQMIEAWRSGTNWIPVHDRTWLARGLPSLAVQFPTHEAFGRATVRDILGAAYDKASYVEAAQLSSIVLMNRGSRFEAIPALQAQLAPAFSVNSPSDGAGSFHQPKLFRHGVRHFPRRCRTWPVASRQGRWIVCGDRFKRERNLCLW